MPQPFRAVPTLAIALALSASALAGQGAPAPARDSSASVRAFVDCQGPGCDNQFFIDQLKWVSFVRDRLFADAAILVSSLRTGSGGTEHTITASGGAANAGRVDTVIVFSAPNDSQDIIRRRLARTFSLLLGPYAARTAAAERMTITYAAPIGATSAAPARDPWNFWIYRVSANGFGSGEKSQNFGNVFLNASANRVTAAWKVNLGSNLSYDQSKFEFSDGSTFSKIQRDFGMNLLAVKSITDHWSAGATFQGNYSDFFNYDLNLKLQPAVEWNYYAYRDFTRKQLTVFYSLGLVSTRYQDTTIYGRIRESHPQHSINIAWNVRQTWGSVNASLFGAQYLHDPSFNSYGISGFTDLRLTKGLSINIGGSYSRVNDQLYLRRGTLSTDQVIARQEALATNFRYFVHFGVSYTFGSIFNTVVNPRFNSRGGGGGGGMTISF